jgi:tetratricopeptide (TPR) repeat protein
MKTLYKGYLVLLIGFIITATLHAQKPQNNPKYGADSISRMMCASNLSTMSEFVKIKVFEYAYAPWGYVFRNCPGSSKNIYINGEKILDYKIETAQTDEIKEAYIDTLMLLYDKRIEYFGEDAKILGKKGIDLLKYRRNEVEEAYKYLSQSLAKSGNKADAAVLATLVTTSSALFKAGKIGSDEMINNYIKSTEAIDAQKTTHNLTIAKESIEKTFAESGAANCDALVAIFTPKYNANKKDIETLKKITELFEKTKCLETDLFAQASESLYAIEPSAKAGSNLAMIFSTRGEYQKAKEYYLKAIEQEPDSELRATYFYQLGAIAMKLKEYPDVKKYGMEAIKLKADYGKAYILIGSAYAAASASCGNTNFEKAAVYLVAVDKFAKAKSVDPSVAEEASEMISRYASYFPNNEDAFFEGFTDGKSYTVGCWINETTTIRTLKN